MELRRVLLVSHGYGYHGDLMYFEQIFAALSQDMPGLVIPVDSDEFSGKYLHLPLSRILKFWDFSLNRKIGATAYKTVLRIPAPSTFFRFLAYRPRAVVFIEFTPTALLGYVAAKLLRSKKLLLVESDARLRGASSSGIWGIVKRVVARDCDLVMTNCIKGKNYAKDFLKVSEEKLVVLPYLTSVPPSSSTDENVFSRCDRRVNFLFLNNLTERKGVVELTKAILALDKSSLENALFHFVGEGDKKDWCVDQLQSCRDSVKFYGALPYSHVAQAYMGCDVVICPTLADYRSLSGFEAICFAKALMISRYDGANDEVVPDGHNGFVFDPLNPIDFVEKIEWFISNKELIERLGIESGKVSQKYSIDSVRKNWRSTLSRLFDGDK